MFNDQHLSHFINNNKKNQSEFAKELNHNLVYVPKPTEIHDLLYEGS